jgi:hypothetical protein
MGIGVGAGCQGVGDAGDAGLEVGKQNCFASNRQIAALAWLHLAGQVLDVAGWAKPASFDKAAKDSAQDVAATQIWAGLCWEGRYPLPCRRNHAGSAGPVPTGRHTGARDPPDSRLPDRKVPQKEVPSLSRYATWILVNCAIHACGSEAHSAPMKKSIAAVAGRERCGPFHDPP